ncbi:hypothetical protein H4219_003469 [Mycoemilia scoparia]|uniref:Tyrosinase copper-binding domain-containing protein n=1 Tax=Mycoemilia scoparia TaxID=417184 RepID=A0A9W7ZUT9_9FUNG|nr:hypothetical protein H4219_003469 [Mycoemilia scoparia]
MKFHLTNVFLLLSLIIAPVLGKCKHPDVRREFRNLSSKERHRYAKAVNEVYRRGWVDNLTQNHFTSGRHVHGVPAFFPWHRQFIRDYESLLQKIDPGLTLPYWDWTLDSCDPSYSKIFNDDYMGGNGDPNSNYCLQDGPYKGWQMGIVDPHCLQRQFNMTQYWGPEVLLEVQNNSTVYSELHNRIEDTVHAAVHTSIGGDMAQMISPNDPIFFLHHAMVDKLWYDWQLMGKGRSRFREYNGVDSTRNNVTVKPSDPLPEYQFLRIEDVLDPRGGHLCYDYEENAARRSAIKLLNLYENNTPPRSLDETAHIISNDLGYPDVDINVLSPEEREMKVGSGNPDWWNRMNNLDSDRVHRHYLEASDIVGRLSKLPNFLSPAVVQLAYAKSHGFERQSGSAGSGGVPPPFQRATPVVDSAFIPVTTPVPGQTSGSSATRARAAAGGSGVATPANGNRSDSWSDDFFNDDNDDFEDIF